jgi:hypothetical protein
MKTRLKIIFICLMAFSNSKIYGQVNLVPNPSFEIHDTCPISASQISYVNPWFAPTLGSPDYFDTCSNISSGASVPQNIFGYQYALDGGGYVGIESYDSSGTGINREYVAVKLNSTLQLNIKYYVSFYVSLSDSSREAIDQMGCFFSNDTIKRQDVLPFNLVPHVSNPNFNYLSSKQNWIKISGTYTAQGNENFITIGNFRDSLNTHLVYAPGGWPNYSGSRIAYYYIDYVCVSTDSLTCNGQVGIEGFLNDEIVLFPNPANESFSIKMNKPANLILYDNTGYKIAEQKLLVGFNTILTTSLLSNLYIIEVKSDNKIARRKIIINH